MMHNHWRGVSVIIPVYNRENFLKESIQSVLTQKFSGTLEIIVSDDGSIDKSLQIAESFGPAVRVLRKPNNCLSQGASSARNRGIQAANQPFICFLDSDDFYLPGHLNRMVDLLESRQDICFAFSRMQDMREIDGIRHYSPWTRSVVTDRDVCYLGLTRPRLVSMNTLILRRRVFQEIGLFNESYSNGEDGDLWLRLSECYKGAFLDQFGAVCRSEHGSGQLSNNNEAIIRECALQVFSSALTRYKNQKKGDSYRLFLLKQKKAGIMYYKDYSWRYRMVLTSLMIRCPVCFVRFVYDYWLTGGLKYRWFKSTS